MLLLQTTLWLGVAAIYLGFAGVMGVLLRALHRQPATGLRWLAWLHGGLVLTPATFFILRLEVWPFTVGLAVLAAGIAALYLGATQPSWAPDALWVGRFAHRYFAAAMALAATWALLVAWRQPNLGPTVLAAAAIGASLAALAKTPRQV